MSDEPDWMNSANDRKTPYTDEELEMFVESFIAGLDEDEWLRMKLNYGENETRQKIKASMKRLDERNLVNLEPNSKIH